MDRDTDEAAYDRAVHADELKVAADRTLDPVCNRPRVPPFDRFGHQTDDLPAVTCRHPDRRTASEAVELDLHARIVAQDFAEFGHALAELAAKRAAWIAG